ncbi:DUF2637 domain-containing protein [Nonomuraea phyllanthi]|uniref:DUF2637 domain-containing protein n=1 Tax=Nonomuraea phyllanthi TaxID=2219224 RepID=A0A5C4VG63_9ACTN|nr:DUF2637 domain-containing protein [Nonomuraea phyllanthi]KAB8188785.1 DUF2637 domain-containing protein [Nonomuraea phyllanthi]
MDVTPPSTLRRLGLALAGLAVAALTGAACALSFDDLRALAVTGAGGQDLAFLYPAAFDALLVIALLDVLLLRSARLLVRVQAAFVLVVLIAGAAAANVATALRFAFDERQAAVGVALAPWVMLAVALWLWLLLIKHVQAHRVEAGDGAAETDLVPFPPQPPAEGPAPEIREARPELREVQKVREEPPGPQNAPVAVQDVQEVPVAAAEQEAPEAPVVGRQVTEWPVQNDDAPEPAAITPEPEPITPEPETRAPEAETYAPEPETRPLRWGDRVKPADVLVHPRTDEKDADTQPHPIVAEEPPDPGHGPELADDGEREGDHEDGHEDDREHDDVPAPSGRLRSTPTPPED